MRGALYLMKKSLDVTIWSTRPLTNKRLYDQVERGLLKSERKIQWSRSPFGTFALEKKMRLRKGSVVILLLIVSGCGLNTRSNSQLYKLPSGKQVKITSMNKIP